MCNNDHWRLIFFDDAFFLQNLSVLDISVKISEPETKEEKTNYEAKHLPNSIFTGEFPCYCECNYPHNVLHNV